jgi:hypothetical protein
MSTEQVHNDYRMKCSECKLLMILRAYVHGIFRYMIVYFDALVEMLFISMINMMNREYA